MSTIFAHTKCEINFKFKFEKLTGSLFIPLSTTLYGRLVFSLQSLCIDLGVIQSHSEKFSTSNMSYAADG